MHAKMDAIAIIEKHELHEHWDSLINSKGNSFAVAAHIRNVFQILGNLQFEANPVKFVCCWTPDGANSFESSSSATGGTRTAIRLASTQDIPVYNFSRLSDAEKVCSWIRSSGLHTPFDIPTYEELKRNCTFP